MMDDNSYIASNFADYNTIPNTSQHPVDVKVCVSNIFFLFNLYICNNTSVWVRVRVRISYEVRVRVIELDPVNFMCSPPF